jgi:hypothetical protein
LRGRGASSAPRVDTGKTCKTGLLVWLPLGDEAECGQVQTPQVKIFGDDGRLRFIGSALESFRWVDSAMPVATMSPRIKVRSAAEEARVTAEDAPPKRHPLVNFYVIPDCPPCAPQLETFRTKVLPRLGAGAELRVVTLTSH